MTRLPIILFCFYTLQCFAQNNGVNIKLIIDGNPIQLKDDFKMGFVKERDTSFGVIEGSKFLFPNGIKEGDKLTLLFLNSKYSLFFKSFTVVINGENPVWEIGVDEKPFDKKKHWSIKKWRKVKLVYYVEDSNGGRLTICKTR